LLGGEHPAHAVNPGPRNPLHDDRLGQPAGLADLRNAKARTLAPSEEALDTPLSPPRLHDEPGPATRRSGTYRDGTSTR
jgi:hypothetical protein